MCECKSLCRFCKTDTKGKPLLSVGALNDFVAVDMFNTAIRIISILIVAVYVSGSQIRDSSNRQPLCQVLQMGRYTAVNHTRNIFFYIPVLYLDNRRVNKEAKTTILLPS